MLNPLQDVFPSWLVKAPLSTNNRATPTTKADMLSEYVSASS